MARPDPHASDWSDLDLLTVSEATERLDEEIAAMRREIGELGSAARPAEARLAAARHRLTLLEGARERAHTPKVTVTPGRVRTRTEVEATPGPPD